MKLPRPNYTKLDPFFFAKKRGVLYISEQGFFLGVMSVTFLGPGRVFFGTLGGLSKRRGDLKKGFLAEHRLKKRIICTCMRCQCNSLRGGAGQFLSVKKKDFLQGTG